MQDFAEGKVCPIPKGIKTKTSPQHAIFFKQMVRIMKLTAILLTVAFLHSNATGFSQTVTFSGKNVSLDKVLSAIKEQTGYDFFYYAEQLHGAKKVTINVKKATIEEVMEVCVKDQSFGYIIKGKSIFIINKEEKIKSEKTTLTDPIKDVKGRVVNSNGEPVQGATIKVKETGATIIANEKGEFELNGVGPNVTLIISSVGHETVQIKFSGNSFLSVVLKQMIAELDETVVKGYYNTTRRLNTGNVTTVKGEDIQKQPVSDPILALQGRVPGLYISQTSGIPGAYSKILLRGQNSIANGNNPLSIVDGVPVTSTTLTTSYIGGGAAGSPGNGPFYGLSPFNNLNPSDIESIEVLKDADATAIYGSRGANGVILITTKKGKTGKTKFDIDVYSAAGKVARFISMMNTPQYLEMRREAFANDGKTPGSSDVDLNGIWDTSSYTNWQKVLIGGASSFTNVQGSLSGGNLNTKFLIAGGYSKQTTVYPGDFSDQKASLHFNINHTSENKKFNALFSGGYVKDNNHLPQADFASSIIIAPNAPSELIDDNGNLIWGNSFDNPFAYLRRKAKAVTNNILSSLNVSYEIIRGLELKSSLGYTHIQLNQSNITYGNSWPSPLNADPNNRKNDWAANEVETWIIEPQLDYTRKIKEGKLDFLIGTSFQASTQNSIGYSAKGFSSDDLIENVALASSLTFRGSNNTEYHYNAIYGRINYNWKDKYLINLTARRDGSSRFGPGKQFGNFGAAGIGWIFSNEKFIQNSLSFLSYGKLRASYGTSGNDQIPDYQYLSTYSGYTTSSYQGVTGLYPTQIANPYYGWETVKKLEGGLEIGFLHDRILLNLSYYRNRTDNQLVGYALPSIAGFTSIYANLPAVVQNTGIEMELNTVNIRAKYFTWSSSLNISIPRNKLISFPGLASSSYRTRYQEGESLFIQYLYHVTGVDPQTGIYAIEDVDTNGAINSSDNQFIKQVAQKYYGGFQNTFSYKGFELNVLFQFVKQTGFNYFKSFGVPGFFNSGSGNQPVYALNRWQKAEDNVPVEKYTQGVTNAQIAWRNARNSGDYAITDASFIRLKNLALSYLLPKKWLAKIHLSDFRIYMQAQNLITITDYQGLDPETQGLSLPPLRMIAFGIHASL